MAAFAYFISFSSSVLIILLLLSGSLAEKYDNRNSENIENRYKNSRYRTEKNNNSYRYDSGNTYKADLTAVKDVGSGDTNFGHQNNHHTASNRKYDNRNEENIKNSYENSNYTTKKNNNIYHYDSENSYVADLTTAKDVGRGNTNFGHQNNNHHTGGNSPGLKYDSRNNENRGNIYKNSCYETEKNNNNYLYDSGNSYVADLTAAEDVGRGNTNFGYKNNHHTDGNRYNVEGQGYRNSENSESINVMAHIKTFIRFLGEQTSRTGTKRKLDENILLEIFNSVRSGFEYSSVVDFIFSACMYRWL